MQSAPIAVGRASPKFLLPRDVGVIGMKLAHIFDCIKGNELLSGPVIQEGGKERCCHSV